MFFHTYTDWLWQSKAGRLIVHTPHGIGIGYLALTDRFSCVIWLVLCGVYQVIEIWEIKDKSYLDWRGYMVGFWIGVTIARLNLVPFLT